MNLSEYDEMCLVGSLSVWVYGIYFGFCICGICLASMLPIQTQSEIAYANL